VEAETEDVARAATFAGTMGLQFTLLASGRNKWDRGIGELRCLGIDAMVGYSELCMPNLRGTQCKLTHSSVETCIAAICAPE
jgi:hypothetical protein